MMVKFQTLKIMEIKRIAVLQKDAEATVGGTTTNI